MGCCTSSESVPDTVAMGQSQWVKRRQQRLGEDGFVAVLDLSGLETGNRDGRAANVWSAASSSVGFAASANGHSQQSGSASSGSTLLRLPAGSTEPRVGPPMRLAPAGSDSVSTPHELHPTRNPLRDGHEDHDPPSSFDGDYGDLRSPAVVTDLTARRATPASRRTTRLSHSARVLRFSPSALRASQGESSGSPMVASVTTISAAAEE